MLLPGLTVSLLRRTFYLVFQKKKKKTFSTTFPSLNSISDKSCYINSYICHSIMYIYNYRSFSCVNVPAWTSIMKSAVFARNRLWDYVFFFFYLTGHQSSRWCDAERVYWQVLHDGWLTSDDYLRWQVFLVPGVKLSVAFTVFVQTAR